MDLPRSRAAAAVAALSLVVGGGAATAARLATHAGPQSDGTAVTPVGFKVTPAGTQTTLGDLPLTTALSPDGRTMLVSNDGQGTQSLQVVDTATSTWRNSVRTTGIVADGSDIFLPPAWVIVPALPVRAL